MTKGFVYGCNSGDFINLIVSINALRHYSHAEPICVYDLGLRKDQCSFLTNELSVTVSEIPATIKLNKRWQRECKSYIMSNKQFDHVICLECNVMPLTNFNDLFECVKDGSIVGIKEGDGAFYGPDHRRYGFMEDFFNNKYVSIAIMALDVNKHEAMLKKWCDQCHEIIFCDDSMRWPEFEQDVFNVIACSSGEYEKIMPLEYDIWYGKWSFINNLPIVIDHKINMATQTGDIQRALYCDFGNPGRVEMLSRNNVLDPLFVYLKFLFNGPTPPSVPNHLNVFRHKHQNQIDMLDPKPDARKTPRLSDDVVLIFNDLNVQFYDGTVVLKFDEPLQAFNLLKQMKFSDAYVFGLDTTKRDQSDIHRLTTTINDFGRRKRKVHICHDSEIPLEWVNFFGIVSHISVSEGLKQTT